VAAAQIADEGGSKNMNFRPKMGNPYSQVEPTFGHVSKYSVQIMHI
jgi:hypothetical protein